MKQPSQRGFVYFVKPRWQSGPIKIGFSKQMDLRITALSAASPLVLEIIGTVPASVDDEYFLHRCFADQYSHGEWFHPSADLHAAIESILQKGIQYARESLTEKGHHRQWSRKRRPLDTRNAISRALLKSWANRKTPATVGGIL